MKLRTLTALVFLFSTNLFAGDGTGGGTPTSAKLEFSHAVVGADLGIKPFVVNRGTSPTNLYITISCQTWAPMNSLTRSSGWAPYGTKTVYAKVRPDEVVNLSSHFDSARPLAHGDGYKCDLKSQTTGGVSQIGFITWVYGEYINGPKLTFDHVAVENNMALRPFVKNIGTMSSDVRVTMNCRRLPTQFGSLSYDYGTFTFDVALAPGQIQNYSTHLNASAPLKKGEYWDCQIYSDSTEQNALNLLPVATMGGPIP